MSLSAPFEPRYPFQEERQAALEGYYDAIYAGGAIQLDSPKNTREEIVHNIATIAERGLVTFDPQDKPLTVLNLGSGPQALEKEFYEYAHQGPEPRLRRLLEATRFITLDIASIPADRLLLSSSKQNQYVSHINASSTHIPLADTSVDVVVSNMSVDMLRVHPRTYDRAVQEISRVLKHDGMGLFTFHHPQVFESHASSPTLSPYSYEGVYFNPNAHNPFYSDKADIVTDFALAGLEVDVAQIHADGHEKWWHIETHKLPTTSID